MSSPRKDIGRTFLLHSVVLAAVVLVGLPGVVAATDEEADDFGSYLVFGQGGWTVRWQAKTGDEDGVFRLYAGQDLGSLRIVDLQPADVGVGSYLYKDMADGSAWLFYQLRYTAAGGDEVVLGTLRVDVEGMGATPATIDLGSGGLKAHHAAMPYLTLSSRPYVPHRSAALRVNAVPEPEVPPPRPTI